MIKLKLSDSTKLHNQSEEYVLNDYGEVLLNRTHSFQYEPHKVWTDYSKNVQERVLGYVKLEVSIAKSERDYRSKADLSSFTQMPAIGLHPLIVENSGLLAEAEIKIYSIEELVTDFDIDSIPQEERQPTKP